MKKEDVLFKDYEATQSFIDKVDGFLFWIRNWTIVACSAVIAFAITRHCITILLANIFILVGFLVLELIQKSFHEDALKHACHIEAIVQACILGDRPFPDDYQFGIGHAIQTIDPTRLIKILLHPGRRHNVAFYVLILFFSLGTVLMIPFVPKKGVEKGPLVTQYFNQEKLDHSMNHDKR